MPTPDHVGIDALDVSAIGDKIAYTARTQASEPSQLWLADLSGNSQGTVTPPNGQSFNCVRWSPDGSHLLLSVTDVAFTHTIGYLTVDAATFAATPLPIALPGSQLSCADWTHDARHIVYAAANSTPPTVRIDQLWEVDTDGSNLRKVGQLPAPCVINDPAVSPDDRLVAVDVICPQGLRSNNGIWTVAITDGTTVQLVGANTAQSSTGSPDQYWNPRWLPNGTGLIYGTATTDSAGSPHALGIWQTDANGQNPHQLTTMRTGHHLLSSPP